VRARITICALTNDVCPCKIINGLFVYSFCNTGKYNDSSRYEDGNMVEDDTCRYYGVKRSMALIESADFVHKKRGRKKRNSEWEN